jgi:hypothetical protein
MVDGHYLNLPVVDSQNTVIGIVDVLKLTYATLEQVNQMNTPEGEGPMWNRFWNTLDNDTESVHSGDGHSQIHSLRAETPSSPEHMRMSSMETPPLNRLASDTVIPNDSASMSAMQDRYEEMASGFQSPPPPAAVAPPVDESFVFKFKSPAGRVHRLRFDPALGLEQFRNVLGEKLNSEEKAVVGGAVAEDAGFAVSFVDDEGDLVSILSLGDYWNPWPLQNVLEEKRSIYTFIIPMSHRPSKHRLPCQKPKFPRRWKRSLKRRLVEGRR